MANTTNVDLKENERANFAVTPQKPGGAPGEIQSGSLSFETQSGGARGVVVDDGHVRIRANGSVGPFVVIMTGDADLGDGVVPITHIFQGNASPILADAFGVTPEGVETDPDPIES